MSTDPVILSALASRIADIENDESLRYFEVVTTKRSGKPRLCYICIGQHSLCMIKMNMKGVINGGTIGYECIDKVVVDPTNNSALLLILESHQDGGWQNDQVPIASDGRHALLSHLIIAWQTHHMWKSDKLRYLPVVEYPLGAMASTSEASPPGVPVKPFRGCVKQQLEGYYVFMPEDYQARTCRCRKLKPTDREFHFVNDKGIECVIQIGESQFISKDREVDLRFLAAEHKLTILENDNEGEWFRILRDGPYMKRMNLSDDLAAWEGWEFLIKTMSVTSACVLLRRKYIPPLMGTYEDITVTVKCPMKIMGKGRFTDEDLIMECRLLADSITTLNEKSTVYMDMLQAKVNALMLNSEAYRWLHARLDIHPSFLVHAQRVVAATIVLLQKEGLLHDKKDLLSTLGDYTSPRSSLCELLEEMRWAVEDGVGDLLRNDGENNDSEAVRNAWYSRAASYLAYCVNGGLLGTRLTLPTILTAFSGVRSTIGKESIRGLLCFLLHVRHSDFDVSYQPDDIRLVAGENSKLCEFTYNCEVMEVLVETDALTSLLKVEDNPHCAPGEVSKLIFANLLGHPSSSLSLKICVCKKITALKKTPEVSAASSGSTTPSSACRQEPETTKPSEVLVGTLLHALRKEKALVLRIEITIAITSVITSCMDPAVKEASERSGLIEMATTNLAIKDDALILASLNLLCCLIGNTTPMKEFAGAVRAAAQIIRTNCDTKSKANVVAHACKFLGAICRDHEVRALCLGDFPSIIECILTAFCNAAARSSNQAMCLRAIHSLCGKLSEGDTVVIRDAVTGVLVRDLGELFIRLIPRADGSGFEGGLVEYIDSALLLFEMLTGDGMESNCLFFKEKGLPHVLSSMRSKLPTELTSIEIKASALEERVREGSFRENGLCTNLMVVEGG